jgi:hypothetical protein
VFVPDKAFQSSLMLTLFSSTRLGKKILPGTNIPALYEHA